MTDRLKDRRKKISRDRQNVTWMDTVYLSIGQREREKEREAIEKEKESIEKEICNQ